jgi:hypothetical protein
MEVGWVWLVDCDRRRIETFVNVRGQMRAGPVLAGDEPVAADPFGPEPLLLGGVFL